MLVYNPVDRDPVDLRAPGTFDYHWFAGQSTPGVEYDPDRKFIVGITEFIGKVVTRPVDSRRDIQITDIDCTAAVSVIRPLEPRKVDGVRPRGTVLIESGSK